MRARLVLVLVSHHRLTQPAPAPRASVEWLVEFGFFGFGYPHRLPVEFVFDALSRVLRGRACIEIADSTEASVGNQAKALPTAGVEPQPRRLNRH
jgi:hypothetical protein